MMILAVTCQPKDDTITLFLAGDSTVADKPYKEGNPEKGWGQVFPLYFEEGVKVENHAVNGRSTKSFKDQGRWDAMLDRVSPGDYVLVEFGHNDSKAHDTTRYAPAYGAYTEHLRQFVLDVRDKKATPVLLTPIVRRLFDEQGSLVETHGDYPDAVRQVAQEMEVILIDLHASTRLMVDQFGQERSKKLFLHIDTMEYAHLQKPIEDDTHLSAYGAFKVADMVVEQLKENTPELTPYFKP
ncbi:rhamnogalacturonan acetylesterase [Geofilum rubicundum JCM 15548]|uniref:Rhamnogalacturonan acetylesterase n=2 Tax=Geofilum TaxID=1236988 RepID=A0A0E9LY33_9BACT|nr:rhamnogalacturonan acetylesterase [Geofilum rubicundum JCM 15548]